MSTTVYLASYKGTRPGWVGVLNRLIRWATRGMYSHTEVCLGNPFNSAVLCVSAVADEGGVRGKIMRLNPDNWDVLPLEGVTEDAVYLFLARHAGAGYDLIGAVRTVLPFVAHEHPTKWFCSEIAAELKRMPEAWRFHPTVFHRVVEGLQRGVQ